MREERLNVDIVFERIREKDRMVDQRVVEGVAVRLVLQKRWPFNTEHLETDADDWPQESVVANVIGAIREANHGFVASRFGVDALRVRLGQSTKDFNLCPGETVALGMGVAHHTPNPLGCDRTAHTLFNHIEDRLEGSLEVG